MHCDIRIVAADIVDGIMSWDPDPPPENPEQLERRLGCLIYGGSIIVGVALVWGWMSWLF